MLLIPRVLQRRIKVNSVIFFFPSSTLETSGCFILTACASCFWLSPFSILVSLITLPIPRKKVGASPWIFLDPCWYCSTICSYIVSHQSLKSDRRACFTQHILILGQFSTNLFLEIVEKSSRGLSQRDKRVTIRLVNSGCFGFLRIRSVSYMASSFKSQKYFAIFAIKPSFA